MACDGKESARRRLGKAAVGRLECDTWSRPFRSEAAACHLTSQTKKKYWYSMLSEEEYYRERMIANSGMCVLYERDDATKDHAPHHTLTGSPVTRTKFAQTLKCVYVIEHRSWCAR